ncbi:MAG: cob(I)yrinic acid a,c-diamide adenosyltransferase [Clostridia bacterium]|nr:cob(I)yrinic acid a,c-diamide adenosyltransferase [Clostridia bacterium]
MNKLHVYRGGGKGKTTAAMGLALRALGHGFPVLVAQWMKRGDSGELSALQTFPRARVLSAPPMRGFTYQMDQALLSLTAKEQSAFAAGLLPEIEQARPRMIVLDELGAALVLGLVEEETARALIDAALQTGETVVTGYQAPPWLEARADYLTDFSALRHPYETEGLKARQGIEW